MPAACIVAGEALAARAAPDRDHLRSRCCAASPRSGRARRPATSATPSRPTPRASAARWCATSAATASGRLFHDEPNILHVGRRGEGVPLRPGMFFTIEPMINLGGHGVKVLSDGWTAVTRDRSLSAQFEHTVGVTETGVEIFTLSPAGTRSAAADRR